VTVATATVQGDVLRWARETAGLDAGAAAKRLKVKPDRVAAWEVAGGKFSLVKLREIGAAYKRPLAALLLPQAPTEPPGPVDYRTVPDSERRPLSPRTILALRRARRVQRLARELALTTNEPPRPRLDRIALTDDPDVVAATVRQALGITFAEQRSWRSDSEALRRWSQAVEHWGVLVLQASLVVKEIRGVSMGDIEPPAVVVSTKDAPTARCFSLFHELCHLLVASPGMCDLLVEEANPIPAADRAGARRVESFCNRFAASVLVPDADLRAVVRGPTGRDRWSDEQLGATADIFKVSREALLLRFVSLGWATQAFYLRKREEWREAAKRPGPKFGPRPAGKCIRNNGSTFVALTLKAHERGVITRRDVGDYLGVQLRHVPAIESLLRAGTAP
jgi:Zn-dependent peptidase ImmA (M78 family)